MSRIAPTFPTTQNTPNSINVTTATGFSQGDLVYYNNGDYKSPANVTAPSSVNYPASQPQGTFSGGAGAFCTPVFSATNMQTADNYGSSSCQSMAILTNGNIVQVFRSRPNNYPSFRIVNSSGTIVVAVTAISTSAPYVYDATNIAVCALTGGGFAVMFLTSAGNPAYAVYTNAGAVTTAVTADPLAVGTASYSTPFYLIALANGGFVGAFQNTANAIYIKIYTSTGGTTATWFTPFSLSTASYAWGIAARSDSSICVIGVIAGPDHRYAIYSATGAVIVASTSYSTSTNGGADDITCLSDGTTFAIVYYNSTSAALEVKFLPTGNTLSAATLLMTAANCIGTNPPSTWARVVALSTGGFAVFVTDATYVLYTFFSNANATTLYPASNINGAVPLTMPFYTMGMSNMQFKFKGTVYELSGNLYFGMAGYYVATANFNLISFNTTTYQLNLASNSTTIYSTGLATASATAGAVSYSTTTPTRFSYTAASTANATAVQLPALILSPQQMATTASKGMTSATLSDGRFVIAFYTTSSLVITVNVYSPAGTLLQTIIPGTLYADIGYQSAIRICPLAAGKFAVLFPTAANQMKGIIYSSSYVALYTVSPLSFTSAPYASNFSNDGCWSADGSIISDRIIIVYCNTSLYQYYQVFDNTLTAVSSGTINATAALGGNYVVTCTPAGGFIASYFYAGIPGHYYYTYYPTSATAYQNIGLNSVGNSIAPPPSCKHSPLGGTQGVFFAINASTTINLVVGDLYQSALQPNSSVASVITNGQNLNTLYGSAGAGVSGAGLFVIAYQNNTNTAINIISGNVRNWAGGTNPASSQYIHTVTTGTYPNINVTSGPGYSAVVSYLDVNNLPYFIIVNAAALNIPTTLTAGVTTSNTVSVSSAPVNSGGVANSVLVGIANNTAAAGASATITTNGSATLNTNYSATTATQAFDYQLPNGSGIQGVKGTISGRNVNLIGNN